MSNGRRHRECLAIFCIQVRQIHHVPKRCHQTHGGMQPQRIFKILLPLEYSLHELYWKFCSLSSSQKIEIRFDNSGNSHGKHGPQMPSLPRTEFFG